VAAVHYVPGEAFDRDPFLLFELRGRPRTRVLAALRWRRRGGGAEGPARGRRRRAAPAAPPSVALAGLDPRGFETAPAPAADLGFRIGEPAAPGALLRQLGTPPSWRHARSPQELLAPVVGAAAALARELALRGEGPAPPAPPA
jgi:uncharacterized Zn finger protein